METMSKIIINTKTGEKIFTELTAEEIANELEITKLTASKKAQEDAKAEADAAARQAILDRLGITADEAAILLG